MEAEEEEGLDAEEEEGMDDMMFTIRLVIVLTC
jgi:hypothetical protein